MDTTVQESKNKKDPIKKSKMKILGHKATENYLLNIISYLLNNKNNFEEKLKSNDLELDIDTDSKISRIDKLSYKLKINNISFNPKRDKVNNIKIYKEIPTEIELKDEYYTSINNPFTKTTINIIPSLYNNMYLDISAFPFCYYDTEKKSIKNCFLKFNNNVDIDKFTLCIYYSKMNEQITNELLKVVDCLQYIENIFDYFENVYIIIQVKSKEDIMKIINDNILNKLFLDNDNGHGDDVKKNKIHYIFNNLSNYIITDLNENPFNIFNYEEKYFFILDQNNKIISLKKDIENLVLNISLFILNLKQIIKEKKNYKEFMEEKEKKENEKNIKFLDVLNYVANFKNLDYIFDLEFYFSFSICVNEDYTNINIKKLHSLFLKGELRTREYLYLDNILSSIKDENIKYTLTEIPTIDIDIDFNDMKCFKCSKIIPDDNFLYYCYFCKTKYCCECVHEQLKKKGREKYIDKKHNLIYFKTRNKKNFMSLDKSKFGNNKFAESVNDDQFTKSHSASCNGCSGSFNEIARYVCINCRPGLYLSHGYIDYCQNCIEEMCNDENRKKELEENSDNDIYIRSNNFTRTHILQTRHKHDEHIYLLLPLEFKLNSGSSYSNY